MKKLKILFFGLGSIGQRHLINLHRILGSRADFYALRKTRNKYIIKSSKKSSVDIEKKYKIKIIKSINEVAKDIDLIFITNPSSLHLNTILKLNYLKDKYFFIEKPLDSSLKLFKKFNNLVKKNKWKIFIGYNLRFHKCVIKVQEIIKKKKLGKINYAKFYYGDNLKNWHKYEDYRKSYASRKKLGGGIVLTSIHEFDLMLNFFKNTKILKSYNSHLSNLKIDVEDFSLSVFKNNFEGHKFCSIIMMNFFQNLKERYIKISFEKGDLFADLVNYKVNLNVNNKIITYKYKKNTNQMYLDEIKYFLAFFKKRKKIPDNFNEVNGFKTLNVALEVKKNI